MDAEEKALSALQILELRCAEILVAAHSLDATLKQLRGSATPQSGGGPGGPPPPPAKT